MRGILIFHLLNDYSGSPLVLKNAIDCLKKEYKITLCTNNSQGFLSDINEIQYSNFEYNWSEYKIVTLFRFIYSQFVCGFKVWKFRKEVSIVYINTLLPFGAAIAAKLLNKKVIYHLHEPQLHPAIFFVFLKKIALNCSDHVIFVSTYLSSVFQEFTTKGKIIPNFLSKKFLNEIDLSVNSKTEFRVLMLCSLKAYKGIYEFVELSRRLPEIKFELVLNATEKQVDVFKAELKIPDNIKIFSNQSNVHQFYQRAHVVLNLSHPDVWVESFGMTILESMSYGIPCIVPNVGGVVELIEHDVEGYCINVDKIDLIIDKILILNSKLDLYNRLSFNCLQKCKEFSEENFNKSIVRLFMFLE